MAGMKAAVIGCGGMGSGHATKAKDLGLELVGFCDEIEASATRLRDTIGAGYVTTDSGRIMRDDSIDLVIIATHHDAHHPLAVAAAQGRQAPAGRKADVRHARPGRRPGRGGRKGRREARRQLQVPHRAHRAAGARVHPAPAAQSRAVGDGQLRAEGAWNKQ